MPGATDDGEGSQDFSDFMASAEFLSSRDGPAALPGRPRPHRSPVQGGARLAAEADLGAYLTRPEEPTPFAFEEVSLLPADEAGQYAPLYRRPLYLPAAARRQHLLVVSKSGGGKSSRYAEPAAYADLADPDASLLGVDGKGGLAGKLAAAMRTLRPGKRPVVINLADPRRTTHALNLAGGGPPEDVFEDCVAFCTAAEERPGRGDSPFWMQTAARWLTAVLLCLRDEYGRASLADAHHVLEGPRDRLLGLLDRHPGARFAAGMASFLRSGSQNADTALATLCGYLRHFVSDALAATTSADEFRLDRLFRRPTVLVLEFDQADVDRLRPFLNLIVTRLLRAANREAARRPGGRLPRPLCLYLDDLPALGRLPALETHLNTLRSRDVRVVATVQTLAQLDHWYGPAVGEVLAGFGTRVFQPPLEQADAEWASRHAGMMTATDTNSVSGKSRRRSPAVPRPLLTPDEVRMSPGHWFYGSRAATLFLPDVPPVQAWFRPAHELPAYARLSAEALARPRARQLRRRSPLEYRPPGAEPTGWVTRPPPAGVTNTYGWTDEQVQERLNEAKHAIGLADADRAARHWWERHERVNHGRLGVVLRLAEELYSARPGMSRFWVALIHHSHGPKASAPSRVGVGSMGWFRVALTADEQAIVTAERDAHADAHVRRKMLVLWLLHCDLPRAKAAQVAGLGRATVQRYVAAYREGGLDGLRSWDVVGPVSDLAAHTEAIRASLTTTPVRTVAEACARIETLTGIRRRPTQVRQFLAGLGFRWRRVRAIPVPPKRASRTTSPTRRRSSTPS